jgi:hypothetical protein
MVMTRKPLPLLAYESCRHYYAARRDRIGGNECDYGCWWRWGSAHAPRYRVTYALGSGEIYVMQFGGRQSGRLEVYGYCPDYELLERALEGWSAQCGLPRSLLWLASRLKEAGLDKPRTSRLSALAG